MITPSSVQRIIDAVRIEEVVGEFVNLKRSGSGYKGLCPFHSEKSGSFMVAPAKNIFKCFGCGKGGDSIAFIKEIEGIGYGEALRYLAKKYNIEIEETAMTPENLEEKNRVDALNIINMRAQKFFQEQLLETDRGLSVGYSYFEKRKFSDETIRAFGLGYAPPDRDVLTKQLQSEGYSVDLLQQVGLAKLGYDNHYNDFFRDRVIFPIYNVSGKPIAFTGRIMMSDPKAPKYINSPETEVYSKSKALYGLYQSRQAIQKADLCYLVEGNTDVISLHQGGIKNVVASSGTALTVEQLRLIKRFTPNVTIVYDSDSAGIKAALRGLDLALEEDMNVRLVLLPEKEDPDSFINTQGGEVVTQYLKDNARDFIIFKAELLQKETANDPIGQSKVMKEVIASIAKISDTIKRQNYIKTCAAFFKFDESIIVAEMSKIIRKKLQERHEAQSAPSDSQSAEVAAPDDSVIEAQKKEALDTSKNDFSHLERAIAALIVNSGAEHYDTEAKLTVAQFLVENLSDVSGGFTNYFTRKIFAEATTAPQNDVLLTPHYFLSHPDEAIRNFAADVMSSPFSYSENWDKKLHRPLETQPDPEKNFVTEAIHLVKHFKIKYLDNLIRANQEKLAAVSLTDSAAQMQLLKMDMRLKEMRNQIAVEMTKIIV